MLKKDDQRIEKLHESIQSLTSSQITWLENTIKTFSYPHNFEVYQDGLLDAYTLENFGPSSTVGKRVGLIIN